MLTFPNFDQILAGLVLWAAQFLVALPWLWAFDSAAFAGHARRPVTYLYALAGLLAGGVFFGWVLAYLGDPQLVQTNARYYASILHAQLILDVLILAPQLLVLVWPRGGAVALAAFREGYRQPMFWVISLFGILLIAVSVVVPYFTFGDDYKMMKQLGFDITMLFAALFGVLAASISIYEEIEGRTAITLISKPVTRRQFLLGKFVGIAMAAGIMTLVLGWVLNWALYVQPSLNPLDETQDPMPGQAVEVFRPAFQAVLPGDQGQAAAEGFARWTGETFAHSAGLLLGFGQVVVLIAIASTLATRMPFVANLVVCLLIFFLGNLSPVLVEVTRGLGEGDNSALLLVGFLAQLFDAILPALQFFQMGPAIIRDSPIDLWSFVGYVFRVGGYALIYASIVLLFGLILFEDRDLA